MTATSSPTGPTYRTAAPAIMRPWSEGNGRLPLEFVGEVALALVTITAALAMRRLLVDGDWLWLLVLHAVVAHTTAAALRRVGVPTGIAVVSTVLAAIVTISWIHAGEATTHGVPTRATLEALWAAIETAFSQFSDVKAPAPALDGFLIGASAGIWISAILGDLATFRADGPIEAVLPSLSLVSVSVVLGDGQDRLLTIVPWFGALLALVLFRRAARLERSGTWVGEGSHRGPGALVALGSALAIVASLAALVVGPLLPGAESAAVVDPGGFGGSGSGTRVTVSPLVDIRSRLVQQANVEVFTVRSDVRAYWRLTSLDQFDGRIWSSNGSYGRTSGPLDEGVESASERLVFDQEFRISALSQIWLPAAYEPRRVGVTEAVRYDEVSGTLIVDTDVPTSNGASYAVTSALPQHDPARLASASTVVPNDIAERYLPLPDDFSPAVAAQAGDITAGSSSPYDAARRLQDYFRDNFTYDLDVGAGHGSNAIEDFVFRTRVGYCEQFAGTFAAMARSIGIPARVAVGFTPGVPDPSDPTLYRVRGEHAHAWPEVFLGEFGWVAFEPTPSRGAPFAENYTGVAEQQAETANPDASVTPDVPPSTEAPTTPRPFDDPGGLPAIPNTEDVGSTGDGAANPWPGRIAIAAVVLVFGLASYVAAVLGITAWRRRSRHRRATTPSARIDLAWSESLDAVRRAGVEVSDAETQSQAAARIARAVPTVAKPFRALAGAVEAAAFAPGEPEHAAGTTALALAHNIDRGVAATQDTATRIKLAIHPRRLREGHRPGG